MYINENRNHFYVYFEFNEYNKKYIWTYIILYVLVQKKENMKIKYKYIVQCKVQIQYFKHFKEQHCRFEVCCLEFSFSAFIAENKKK